MIVLCTAVFLLWSHVAAYFQTAPYVTFMGVTLSNNSYVDANLVGDRNSGGEGVQCHTDLTTCCSRHQGMDLGDWYAPGSETRLPFENSGSEATFYERRGNQKVTLYRRSNDIFQSGIYHCNISVTGSGGGRETVYIGIYKTGGIIIMDEFILSSAFFTISPL